MIKIIINNNNDYELVGNLKILNRLYKAFKVKNPNAFFLRKANVMGKGWDGCIDYIRENGKFKPGLLEEVVAKLKEYDEKVEIIDNRHDFNVKPQLPKKVGENIPRGYQKEALLSLINHRVCGVPHYIGVFDMSTNAGKTTLMAGIHLAFRSKIPTIVLIKEAAIFEQLKKEMPKLLPGEDIKFIRGKQMEFGNFTIAMVPTLSPKAKDYKNQLAKFGICLVDEADQGNSRSYKNCLAQLYNCKVRIGLSGSIYMGKLKKDETKNRDLKIFFGEVLYRISKKEMADLGFSTPVIVRIWPGNKKPGIKGFPEEYNTNITQNRDRAQKGIDIMKWRVKMGKIPALVIFHYIEHGELLYKMFKKAFPKLKVALAHGSTKDRKEILERFREGKIDILIGSFIIKRGQNMPLIKNIQNQAASDSQETISQIMGRGERKHESKKRYYLDDFMDQGKYLSRHSKHRINYYKEEGFKIIIK